MKIKIIKNSKIVKNLFKLLFAIVLLVIFVGCSKGGSLTSAPLNSNHENRYDNKAPGGQDGTNDPNGIPGGQDGTSDPNGVPGGQDGTSDPNGVPGGQDGTSDPNGVPGGQDGTSDPNGVPGGQDGANEDNSGEESYQFSITQSVHEQKEVDILMVIDNSGSMNNNHKNLGQRFGNLFNDNLQRVDWQMAFISSCFGTTNNPEVFYNLRGVSDNTQQIISPELENPENAFQNTISSKQGGACSVTEFEGILNMINSPETHPEGFFRQDALLAIVIVTDERDNTDVTSSDIITAVEDNFGQLKQFTTYGLIVEPGDVMCDNQEPDVHYKVDQLVQKTGGITGSICAEDYSPIMTNIGNHIERTLEYHEVLLKHTNVIEDSINLNCTLSQSEIECPSRSFDSVANKILFDTPPAEGVTVQISYRYRSD